MRIVDAKRVSRADAKTLVTRKVAGQLLAMLYEETVVDASKKGQVTVLSRFVERSEARGLGSDDELFVAALDNVRGVAPENVDVMRVDERCRLFFFRSEDEPTISGRILDLAGLLATVASRLSPEARKLTDTRRGMLVGVPSADLLAVFFVATGDLVTGAVNVIANVLANYEEEDADAVSPWLYWVRGDHIEEMGYELDGDRDVESVGFPNALMDLV